MLRGIIVVLLVLAMCVGGYVLWQREHNGAGELGSGDVVTRKGTDDNPNATTTDLDGSASNGATPTPSRSDAPGTINTAPVSSSTPGAGNQLTSAETVAPQSGTQSGSVGASQTSSMRAPDATTTYTPSLPASLPVSDSIAPNPPNGAVFAGTGAYQWYRQGNITWRVDSKNGKACIAFATMEEWQKSIVMNNGCGRIV